MNHILYVSTTPVEGDPDYFVGVSKGYTTFRTIGDPTPTLRITCPRGADGETCGQAVVTNLTNLDAIAQVANNAVRSLKADGCKIHVPVVEEVTGDELDSALANTAPADLNAAVTNAFQAADTLTTLNGVLVFTGHVEPAPEPTA